MCIRQPFSLLSLPLPVNVAVNGSSCSLLRLLRHCDTAPLVAKAVPYNESPPCAQLRAKWGAADTESKAPSGENTEPKRSPFKAWSKSVYSHTCYAYCQGFLPCLFQRFWSIQVHFFPKPLLNFSYVGCG